MFSWSFQTGFPHSVLRFNNAPDNRVVVSRAPRQEVHTCRLPADVCGLASCRLPATDVNFTDKWMENEESLSWITSLNTGNLMHASEEGAALTYLRMGEHKRPRGANAAELSWGEKTLFRKRTNC